MGAQQLARLSLLAVWGQAAAVERELQGIDDPTLLDRPLHMAAAAGHTRVVELLLGSGADPRSEFAGITPIGLACAGGNLQMVRLLLQWGAVFSNLDDRGARWLAEFVGPLMDCYQQLHVDRETLQAALDHTQHEGDQRLAVIAAQQAEIDALRALIGQLQAGGAG